MQCLLIAVHRLTLFLLPIPSPAMLLLLEIGLLPLIAALLSRLFPFFFFPAPRNGELLAECEKLVVRFVVASAIIVGSTWAVVLLVLPFRSLTLAQAFQYEAFAALFYLFAFMRVAVLRAADERAVLGQRQKTGPAVEMAIRVLNNTTEQLLFSFLARMALAATLANATVHKAMLSLWLTGRLLFLLGYTQENLMGREFGFDLTLISSASALLVALVHTILYSH